ncbi:hypothetical protein GH733_006584, partial [Mirounga leonina]
MKKWRVKRDEATDFLKEEDVFGEPARQEQDHQFYIQNITILHLNTVGPFQKQATERPLHSSLRVH